MTIADVPGDPVVDSAQLVWSSGARTPVPEGVFPGVPEMIADIDEYIAHHNTKPKPFRSSGTRAPPTSCRRQFGPMANARSSSKQNATLHQQPVAEAEAVSDSVSTITAAVLQAWSHARPIKRGARAAPR